MHEQSLGAINRIQRSISMTAARLKPKAIESAEVGVNVAAYTAYGGLIGVLAGELLVAGCTPFLAVKRSFQQRPILTLEDFVGVGAIVGSLGAFLIGGNELIKQIKDPDAKYDRLIKITTPNIINAAFAVQRIRILPT